MRKPWYEIKMNDCGNYVTTIWDSKSKIRKLDGNSHGKHRYARSWAEARAEQLAKKDDNSL